MVGSFVRLKARVLRNRLRRDTAWGLVMFLLVWVGALGLGIGGGVLMATIGRISGAPTLVPVVYGVVFFWWILGPVIVASVEQSVATEHFELLPIGPSRLAVGLLGASLFGPGAVATLLGFTIGTVGGYATDGRSFTALLMVALVATALCVVVARLIVTWLAYLLQGSVSRQLLSVLILAVILVPSLAGPLVASLVGEQAAQGAGSIQVPEWVAWAYLFPPAGLGRAVETLLSGDTTGYATSMAYGVGWVALMVWLWGRTLRRSQVTAPASGRRVRTRSLWPRLLPLPKGPVGAVAAKEFATIRRDPRVRMQLGGAMAAVLAVLLVNAVASDPGPFRTYLPFVAVLAAFSVGTSFDFNLFGLDGGSFWGYAVTPASGRSILAGKNVAWGLLAAGAAVPAGLAGAWIGGSATYLGPAINTAWALVLVWAGTGNLVSIWGAFPIPEQSFYTNRNLSGRAGIIAFVALLVSAVIASPIFIMLVVGVAWQGLAGAWLASVVAVAYGAALLSVGLRQGAGLLEDRMAGLVEVLDAAD